MSGLSTSKEEMELMQKEFLRLVKNKTGTLKLEDLKKISESELGKKYSVFNNTDWHDILQGVDLNGDGVIDF